MIKRILGSRLPVIVYPPGKFFNAQWFRDAALAGALPVLDTEFLELSDLPGMLRELEQNKSLYGIRLDFADKKSQALIAGKALRWLDCIVYHYRDSGSLSGRATDFGNYTVILESTDIRINKELAEFSPQAVILKGIEAGGKVAALSSFVLMQWYLKNTVYPVIVHGGVGMHTAPGLFAAGVSGIVLDSQLYLTAESPLSEGFKKLISEIEASDTVLLESEGHTHYRLFGKLGTKIVKDLQARLLASADEGFDLPGEIRAHYTDISSLKAEPLQSLFYLGQDSIFASHFVAESTSLKNVLESLFTRVGLCLESIDSHDPMFENSALALEHGTAYPVVQGPMANVSDNTGFAEEILAAGGLPCFAFGNLPVDLAEKIISAGTSCLSRYGVGLIGLEAVNRTLEDHISLLLKYKAPYAILAGGTSSLVKKLEEGGVMTYIHAPSASILEGYLESGLKQFVFEGHEAGGHVGGLSSLVLWESVIEKLSTYGENFPGDLKLLFAGGISTEYASFFISGMTSVLAEKGVKIGVSLGTPYLFSSEIVKTGALHKTYQDTILKEFRTILIGKTVGLISRTVPTDFSRNIVEHEHKRIVDEIPLAERKKLFERENLGSLLIAAKGWAPDFSSTGGKVEYIHYKPDEHQKLGNFSSGDSLVFYTEPCKIKKIHTQICGEKQELYRNLNQLEIFSRRKARINDEVAVIGMGCVYPDASSCDRFWENIKTGKYSIKEVPGERMDSDLYFSEDREAPDKSYSKIAGVIEDFVFEFEKFGYTEKSGEMISRSQQIILEAARQAVTDAGYNGAQNLPPYRTGVVIASCLTNELNNNLYFKYFYPELLHYLDRSGTFRSLTEEQKEKLKSHLKEALRGNCADNRPTDCLVNVEAGKVAKHFKLAGSNYCVDAACASSFAALDCAVKSLLSGEHDYVIAGGVNTNLSPQIFVGFSKIQALSGEGSYPFDERAGGFVLGEGGGVLLLKRLKDAIRDKDKIYGIIKGIGSSSDGKGKAIAAPKSEGQEMAIRRCYADSDSGVSLRDVRYIEAHGTSTKVGDATEMATLCRVFAENESVGVSSVKSQIGHLLGGAGMAGMIKALLAIKEKSFPPNGTFRKLSPAIKLEGPVYIIDECRQWEVAEGETRKAGVSSYGFGGINYHLCLEEYREGAVTRPRRIFSDMDFDFNENRIVIIGMGCVLPDAENTGAFWENLRSGHSALSPVPEERFHNSAYNAIEDAEFHLPMIRGGVIADFKINNAKYKLPPSSMANIDRAQLFALDAASQAIEEAGLASRLKDGNRVAVILGNYMGGERLFDNIIRVRLSFLEKKIGEAQWIPGDKRNKLTEELLRMLRARYPGNTEDTVPGYLPNIISGRISNFFNCNGANFTVDALCASSVLANNLAIKGLLSGESEYVITGGSHSNFSPANLKGYDLVGLLSPDKTRVFDKESDGVNPGEGAAVYVLTTLKTARKHKHRQLAEFPGFEVLSGTGPQMLLMPETDKYVAAAERHFRVNPGVMHRTQYLELFGLSILSCDIAEYGAINRNFSRQLYYGNIKPFIGYLFAANPAAVILKLVLMKQHRLLLPNWYINRDSTIITGKSVLSTISAEVPLPSSEGIQFGMNFFGFGGCHAFGTLRSLPHYLNAREESGVKTESTVTAPLQGTFYKQLTNNKVSGKIAVLLSGQGAQYAGMMKDLYYFDETIHFTMDEGDKIFRRVRGYSLLDIIFNNEQLLKLTINTQPAIFLASAAIYNSLKNKGFRPHYFIGHSLGEFTALFCSGILDFKEALKLVIKRSDIMHHTAMAKPGAMLAVFMNAEETARLIKKSGLNYLYLANLNSEEQTVVSSENYKITQFIDFLKKENIFFKKINVSAAFHTPIFKDASKELGDYLETVQFNNVDFSPVFSNVTGKMYPRDDGKVKKLLQNQMISSVKFVDMIKNAADAGVEYFIEVGPRQVLSKFIDKIKVNYVINLPTVYKMYGEVKSFNKLIQSLQDLSIIQPYKGGELKHGMEILDKAFFNELKLDEGEFGQFINERKDAVNKLLYDEYLSYQKSKEEQKSRMLGVYPGDILISGVSVGLPGTKHSVFNRNNFDEIIAGTNYIESLPYREKRKMLSKKITRLRKEKNSKAQFQELKNIDDVIQLAGRLGYFDLKREYGINYDYDITFSLAIAAGIEALKDANIPLVMQYKNTTTGAVLEEGYALPEEMQERTGVIFASAFPGFDTILEEADKYYNDRYAHKALQEIEKTHAFILKIVSDPELRQNLESMFEKSIEVFYAEKDQYKFNRNLLLNIMGLGSTHFAQIIRARGPNTQLNSSCSSTTQAIGMAEDWIRLNRCDRVIIIGADAVTSENLNEWVGTGFLAFGAATNRKRVSRAAVPFGSDSGGMILGSGAVSLVIEKKEEVHQRGMRGQAQILGTSTGNSAYHASRIDSAHLVGEMNKFFNKIEKRYNLKRDIYAKKMLFMSHDSYAPAGGGTAEAEFMALKSIFVNDYHNITITNTKGYTGNTLGAALEDAILVKSLQKRRAPRVANLTKIPEKYRDLKFSAGRVNPFEYGFHFSAGFGSQFAFLFIKRVEENQIQENSRYREWLQGISGLEDPELSIRKHILTVNSRPRQEIKESREVEPAVAAGGNQMGKKIKESITAIISGQTGYGEDMLAEDMDFEADLGIDTVKQVQIFGRISSELNFEIPEDLKLSELNTIGKLTSYFDKKSPDSPLSPRPEQEAKPEIRQKIVSLISGQTGYTEDMLGDNLDFEADLGIDTVKQVQLFGKVSAGFSLEIPEDLSLSRYNTIAKLEQYVSDQIKLAGTGRMAAETTVTEAVTDTPPVEKPRAAERASRIRRYVISPAREEAPGRVDWPLGGKTFLLTCDSRGFAAQLKHILEENGAIVFTSGYTEACTYELAPHNAGKLKKTIQKMAEEIHELDGVFHFLPLDFYFKNRNMSAEAIFLSVKLLFLLLRKFQEPLNRKDAIISTLCFDSLVFPYVQQPPDGYPLFAALGGMLKSVRKEWPAALVKAVDFRSVTPEPETRELLTCYLNEIFCGDRRVETGYEKGVKYSLRLNQKPVYPQSSCVRGGDTVLVAGGSRGITFELVKAMLKLYNKMNFIILGRSDIYALDEKYNTESNLRDLPSLSRVIRDLKDRGEELKPLELRKKAVKLLNTMQALKNIKSLEASGARVQYHAVDVTNGVALKQVVRQYRKIDGVIFASGVDDSNLITRKTLRNFEFVFDTKIKGVLRILKALELCDYRYFLAFSSITAKLGNQGQVDYTAANDMLDKIILAEQKKFPSRVYKVYDWTAWGETGMAATGTSREVLSGQGVEFLGVEEGACFFLNELYDRLHQEVVMTAETPGMDQDQLFDPRESGETAFPFLGDILLETADRKIYSRLLDIEQDIFLNDHVREETPLLPGAVGLEILVEAAAGHKRGHEVLVRVDDFVIPYGIKLIRKMAKEIFIETVAGGEEDGIFCSITSFFMNQQGCYSGEATNNYGGVVHWGVERPVPARVGIPVNRLGLDRQKIHEAIYASQFLQFGPQFFSVKDILMAEGDEFCTLIHKSGRERMLKGRPEPSFLLDPVLIDATFQSCGLMEMITNRLVVLPSSFRSLHLYSCLQAEEEYYCKIRRNKKNGNVLEYNIQLLDREGRECLRIEAFKMVQIATYPELSQTLAGVATYRNS